MIFLSTVFTSIRRTRLFLAGCATLLSAPLWAFKPTADHGHAGITREGMAVIARTASSGQTLTFSDLAIDEVREANADTDSFGIGGGGWKPAYHCDDELLPECSRRLIDLKRDIIGALKQNPPDGKKARQLTGTALHTLQDFYAHSNWVLMSGSIKHTGLGGGQFPRPPETLDVCMRGFGFSGAGLYNADGLRTLTTGYFTALGTLSTPDGKCHHGLTESMDYSSRISKDWPNADYTSQATHAEARVAAVASTTDYIEQILDAPGIVENDAAIRAFMDAGAPSALAMDKAAAISRVIEGNNLFVAAADGARSLTADAVVLNPWQSREYVVANFRAAAGSRAAAMPEHTTSRAGNAEKNGSARLAEVCPVLHLSEIEQVIDTAANNSRVLMLSDAAVDGGDLWPLVAARAKKKNIVLSTAAAAGCASADPVYAALATATGGQLMATGNAAEDIEKVFESIRPGLEDNLATVFLARGHLDADRPERYRFYVDSSVRTLVVTVASDAPGAARIGLLNPQGRPVGGSGSLVDVTEIRGSRIFTLADPQPGEWMLELRNVANFFVDIGAVSDIDFAAYRFVEQAGRAAHTGLFQVQGEPVAGESTNSVATVFGDLHNPRLVLLDSAGKPIAEPPFTPHPDIASNEYYGAFILPDQRFRPMILAENAFGETVMRTFNGSFMGHSVKVTALSAGFAAAAPGSTYTQRFRVTNRGPAGRFSVSASTGGLLLVGIDNPLLVLGHDKTREVELTLTVPDTAKPGEVETVAVLVQGAQSHNTAIISAGISAPRLTGDLDGDADIDSDDINLLTALAAMPASGNSDIRDIDGNGVVDKTDIAKLREVCTRTNCVRGF